MRKMNMQNNKEFSTGRGCARMASPLGGGRVGALLVLGIFSFGISYSQRDTTKPKAIDITSSFKPVLKDAAKINFNATPPSADTSKPRLQYEIPNPNLLFAYQPGTLKPLALQIDSAGKFDNSTYIKAGFGSLRTPYIQAGFSFGDGNTAGANIYAKHVASQGKREFQDFTNTQVKLIAPFCVSPGRICSFSNNWYS